MNSILISKMLKIFIIIITVGCVVENKENINSNQHKNSEQANFNLDHFGHLTGVKSYSKSSMFLIGHDPEASYKICLSTELTKKFPGIRGEVEAAANIWAHYINRKILLQIKEAYIPFPSEDWSNDQIREIEEQMCGKDMDLVINEVRENGNRLGETSYVASYRGTNEAGKKNIINFHRTLSLTRFVNGRKFVSLEQATGIKRTGKEILDLLISRQRTVYLPKIESFLTLRTIIHEFGHIWGLCDQYPLAGNKTNCDPEHSILSHDGHIVLEEDAIMSSNDWIVKLGLHDDDINGIYNLALRTDIDQGTENENLIHPSELKPFKESVSSIKFAKLLSASIESGKIRTTMAVDISMPYKITLRIHRKKGETVTKDSVVFNFTTPEKSRQQILLIKTPYANKTVAVDALIEVKDASTKEIIEQFQSETFVLETVTIEEAESQEN